MKITVVKKSDSRPKPMSICPWIVENPSETKDK